MIETPLAEWDGESVAFLGSEWGASVVEAYACVDSTSRRAAELAGSGCRPYTVVVADEQTAGRGRRGDTWSSPRGCGLWMSVVLPASVSRGLAHLPLLLGLATAEAIEVAAPTTKVWVKWPNDLWVRGRKVAGILCESSGGAVVAGIGVNVTTPQGGFPEELRQIAASLEDVGAGCLSRGPTWRYRLYRRTGVFVPAFDSLSGFAASMTHASSLFRYVAPKARLAYYRFRDRATLFNKIPSGTLPGTSANGPGCVKTPGSFTG